jgi:hypothetical protein
MFNNILLAAAATIPVTPLCAPILAGEATSPKPVIMASAPVKSGVGARTSNLISSLSSGGPTPPSMSLGVRATPNNIACRNTARSKLFELGARDMSDSNNNSQWATVGNMRVLVWCRDTQAIISVAGNSYDSVTEVRDVLGNAF